MKMNSPVSGLALALAAGLLLAAAPMAAPAQALDPAAQRALDAYVESAMADWGVPGVAIAVVKDDQVVMARGYGEREVGSGEPVDENTVFAIASITKSFTSAAMGMLVEEGRVAWDDPVTEHLSGFQLADPWVTREFTIRDLLSHRAGVERGDWLWFGTDYDRDEVVHHLRYLRPVADFRADYGYSNNMYIAAGQLIAEVTGTNWDDFVTRRIFEPLGMRRSNTTVRALPAMDNVAAPHEELNGALTTVPPGNLDNEGPGGSINSSVAQMAQWIRLMLNGGEVDGRRLLDSATIAKIHSPHVVIPVTATTREMYPGVHFMAYAFGWQLLDYRGRGMVQHGGAFDGMRSQVALLPEENLGMIVLTNRGRGHELHGALRNRVLDAFLGVEDEDARDWSAEYLARVREREARWEAAEREWDAARVAGTSPSLTEDAYAGRYEDQGFGPARVWREDGALRITLGPRHTGTLEHWHYDTYVATWDNPMHGRNAVTFNVDAEGRVADMDVRGVRVYRRVDGP